MKFYCLPDCGCHFPEDFEETLAPGCTFWSSRGFPERFRNRDIWLKELWDAMCSVNFDAFANETGIACSSLDLKAFPGSIPMREDGEGIINQFVEHVPGYEDWPDDKRRRFQKVWIAQSRRPEISELLWNGAMKMFAQTQWPEGPLLNPFEYAEQHIKDMEEKTDDG